MTRQELIDFIRGNIYPNGQNQITAPMVRDAVLAVVAFLGDAAVKDVGTVIEFNDGLVTGGDVYNAIRSYLSTVLNLVGETTTDIVADPTANPVYVDGEPHTAKKGDVVIYGAKEFWWNGSQWKELGDEASWALKTTSITGTGDIAGGGTLEANRTLDLTQEAKDKLAHGETAFSWFESYLQNRLRLKTPYDYLNARKGLILEPNDYATTPADLFKQVVTIDGVETTILRSKLPIVSDSFMSAGGLSANSGGGGGGISLDAMWNSLTNSVPDAYASTPINIAHIPNITVSKVSDIESWINGKGYMTNADLSNYLPLTGGTMSNTNLVTNMNADLLDGHHNGDLSANTAVYLGAPASLNSVWEASNEMRIYKIIANATNYPANYPFGYLLNFGWGGGQNNWESQMYFTVSDFGNKIFTRGYRHDQSAWTTWHELAFTDSNITGSAASLTTPRTIWGQSFNGTANVDGILTLNYSTGDFGLSITRLASGSDEASISYANPDFRFVAGLWGGRWNIWSASLSDVVFAVQASGNVGIGTTNPAYKLDVNGMCHVSSLSIGAGAPVLEWDAVNSAWHLNGSLYADGFISAGGFSDTSGSGGIDLGAMWGSLTNSVPDEYANTPIALAHIPNITVSKVSNIESWIDGKGYLTSSAAASTYLTIATASSTYQPIISDLSTIRSNASYGYSAYTSLSSYLPLTGGTMANTNLVTNMNADLLDGHHNGDVSAIDVRFSAAPSSLNVFETDYYMKIYRIAGGSTGYPSGYPFGYLHNYAWGAGANTWQSQLYFTVSDYGNKIFTRGYRQDTAAWTSWREIAFVDSNITGSAASLTTSRTIWGQSFNGTANVDGPLTLNYDTGYSGITLRRTTGAEASIEYLCGDFRVVNGYWNQAWHVHTDGFGSALTVSYAGNVGIGNTSPAYKLTVAGDINGTNLYLNYNGYVNGNVIWNAGNDGSGSGLDADLLDGHHNGDLSSINMAFAPAPASLNVWENDLYMKIYRISGSSTETPSGYPYGYLHNYAWGTSQNTWQSQIYFTVSDFGNRIFTRGYRQDQSAWTTWHELAFLDSNVATATALQTSRSIWGQSFNGTADVSGALSGASTGEFSSWVKANYYYVGGYSAYLEYANSAIHANVGFYSNNYISAGGLSTSSDARLKTGVQTIDSERAWKVIMGLRPTEFRWIENGEESAGFIAQEVEQIVPFAVKEIGEVKRLNYDNIFTYGIQAIRDMKFWRESTEQRIKRLEKKIKELQTELNKLRA